MPTGKEGEMLLGHNEPVYKNLCETLEKHKKAIVVTFTAAENRFLQANIWRRVGCTLWWSAQNGRFAASGQP